MYIPIAGAGYWIYGELVEDNISLSLRPGPLEVAAIILITLHLLFAFVILQNPLSQVFEKLLKLPQGE